MKTKYFLYIFLVLNIILLGVNLYNLFAFVNSSPENIISVPDVRNKDIVSATKILIDSGFKPRIQGILMDRSKDSFVVLDQNPLSKALKGSIVDLWINQPAKIVLLPDLRYKNVEEARNLLEKLDLRVEVIPFEEGQVVRQAPDPNFYVEKGSNIVLWVESTTAPSENSTQTLTP
ncbi:MAG: PASTA domain-containing protein [Dictyoglomaceae bacterium]